MEALSKPPTLYSEGDIHQNHSSQFVNERFVRPVTYLSGEGVVHDRLSVLVGRRVRGQGAGAAGPGARTRRLTTLEEEG